MTIYKRLLIAIFISFILLFYFSIDAFSQMNYAKLEENGIFKLIKTPNEEIVIEDAKDDKLDRFNLLKSSMIAEGIINESYIDNLAGKVSDVINNIKTTPGYNSMTIEEKAKLSLDELYRTIFRTYVADETTTSEILKSGRYNCVSSTIVYNYVVGDLGINSFGVIVPNHIFSFIDGGNGKLIEVQTTSKNGFNPDTNMKKQIEKLTGVPIIGLDANVVPNTKLLAVLYSNIAVYKAKKTTNYANALSDAIKAVLIYPDFEEAKGNIISILLTWLQYTINKSDSPEKYDAVINFNKKGIEAFNEIDKDSALKQNLVYSYSKYSEFLTTKSREKQHSKAISILEEGKAYLSEPRFTKDFDGLIKVAYLNYIGYLSNGKRFEDALRISDEALSKYPNDKDILNTKLMVFYNYALTLSTSGNAEKSISILDNALNQFTDTASIQKLLDTKLDVYKNIWSAKMREKKFDEAFEILNNAEQTFKTNKKENDFYELLKQTYIGKTNSLVKLNKFDNALNVLAEAFTVHTLKEDKNLIQTTKYTLQEYSNYLVKTKSNFENTLQIFVDWLGKSYYYDNFYKEVRFYTGYYVRNYIQEEWKKARDEQGKETILKTLETLVYDSFPSIALTLMNTTLDKLNAKNSSKLRDLSNLKKTLDITETKLKELEKREEPLTLKDIDIFNLSDYYTNLFLEYLQYKVDNGNYSGAVSYLFNSKWFETNTIVKDNLYNYIYKKSQQHRRTQDALELFKETYVRYDRESESLSSLILSIYTEDIKSKIKEIYITKKYKIESEKQNAINELDSLINNAAIRFFNDNKMHLEVQTFYIIVSVEYYRASNLENSLRYSLEGHRKYNQLGDPIIGSDKKEHRYYKKLQMYSQQKKQELFDKNREILKNNTIKFYLERAKELVDTYIPTQIPSDRFERDIIREIKRNDDKTTLLSFYTKNNAVYVLKEDITEDDKLKIILILKSVEYVDKNLYSKPIQLLKEGLSFFEENDQIPLQEQLSYYLKKESEL